MRSGYSVPKRIAAFVLFLVLIHIGIGVGFHIGWKRAQADCRHAMMARGEFVEPEVFGGIIGLAFDGAFWPVYYAANVRLDGTPFATPCTH
jgi:hypothetical protein